MQISAACLLSFTADATEPPELFEKIIICVIIKVLKVSKLANYLSWQNWSIEAQRIGKN